MSAVSVSEPGVRPILADAVDVARRALLELEPAAVGAHLGVTAEDDSAATHRFEATLRGYRGWQWAVVVAAPPGADRATVSESALLPGPDALVAPDFLPWDQRVRPGDLAPGDLLATPPGDPRLVPGYTVCGDPAVDDVAVDIGLGRTKVMSLEGREEAAERWYAEHGPDTDMAKAAPSTCGRCGFYLPLAGALRAAFGVCGNTMGADGRVVHSEYGCGAHSDVEPPAGSGSPQYEAYDDAAYDVIPHETVQPPNASVEPEALASTETESAGETDGAGETVVGSVDVGTVSETVAESENASRVEDAQVAVSVANDAIAADAAPVSADEVSPDTAADAVPTDTPSADVTAADAVSTEVAAAEVVSTVAEADRDNHSEVEFGLSATGVAPIEPVLPADVAPADLAAGYLTPADFDADAPSEGVPAPVVDAVILPVDSAASQVESAAGETSTARHGAGSADEPTADDVPTGMAAPEVAGESGAVDAEPITEDAVANSAGIAGATEGADSGSEFWSSPRN